MKKNSTSQSAFLVSRILLGLMFLVIGVSLSVVGFGQNRRAARPEIAPYPTIIALPGATLTPTPAMTFTVRSTADTGGTTCGAGCTLRQAANASDANPPPVGATNLIAFNIPSNDPGCDPTTHVCTIALTDCLGRSGNFCTAFNQPVTIDGYTQPGASPNTLTIGDNAHILIKIIGDPFGDRVIQLCSPTVCGLPGDSSGSTVRGLCLAGTNHQPLIFLGSNNDVATGNFLGVDTDGTTVVSDGDPIDVGQHSTGNIIGGTSPAARNVMASNGVFGAILNDGDNTVVQGNYLGTNAAGTAAIGSLATGIDAELGTGVTIGGSASGAGNVINATGNGISIGGVQFNAAANTAVQGNLIGTDATGTVALHALFNGIQIGQSLSTTIGGSTPGAGNVINARADGIFVGGTPTGIVIQGNKIGTDINGAPLGNGNCGIAAGDTTVGAIGGVNAGEGNIIAFNALNGVSIAGFTGGNTRWAILGNSIHDNARLGITLATAGCGSNIPTPNDHCDADDGMGANDFQNYPVITSASFSNGNVILSGSLDSVSGSRFRLEFFSSARGGPSGHGEGETFLGSRNVSTNAACHASFGPLSFPVPPGQSFVTATATRLDAMGNPIETSEFSAFLAGPQPSPTPTPTPTATPTTSRLRNISTRSFVQTGDNVMIGGFIIHGATPKRVIIRAIGPELTQFGVPNVLADPTLELHNGDGALIARNYNWQHTIIGGVITHDQVQEIRQSGLAPGDLRESAIIAELPAGNYTAIVRGINTTVGVALVEVYDLALEAPPILFNISTRSFVQTGDNVMIGGFIVHGTGNKRVIIRAIGPELSQFGVPDPLQNPTLELHNGAGALIGSNDNWRTTIIGGIITHDQVQEIRDTGLAPGDGRESAIIAELPPGNYTAIVRGVNSTTGVGLVEVYDLD